MLCDAKEERVCVCFFFVYGKNIRIIFVNVFFSFFKYIYERYLNGKKMIINSSKIRKRKKENVHTLLMKHIQFAPLMVPT